MGTGHGLQARVAVAVSRLLLWMPVVLVPVALVMLVFLELLLALLFRPHHNHCQWQHQLHGDCQQLP